MTTASSMGGSSPRVKTRWWQRLVRTDAQVHADELVERAQALGATAIDSCRVGDQCRVLGVLASVTLRPRSGVPAVVAEIYDGSGSIQLIWLGRRRIRGIEPGRSLLARGRLTSAEGQLVIYNPLYDLMRGGDA